MGQSPRAASTGDIQAGLVVPVISTKPQKKRQWLEKAFVDVIYSWGLLAPGRLVPTQLWRGTQFLKAREFAICKLLISVDNPKPAYEEMPHTQCQGRS